MLEPLLISLSIAIIGAWTVISARRTRFLKSRPASGVLPEGFGTDLRLRDIYRLAVILEEDARDLYLRMAKLVKKPEAKRLCYMLAQEETIHLKKVSSRLGAWRTLAPNMRTWPELLARVKKEGFYEDTPGLDATEEELASFAIRQEIKTAAFYALFEKAFPEAWKRDQLHKLVEDERRHEAMLRAEHPHAKP